MKFWEILRFEFTYQLRRPWIWLSFSVMTIFAFLSTRIAIVPVTLPQDFILNSPFIITSVSVFSCQVWLLLAPVVGGEAAARDYHTGMHALLHTSPISKMEYIGGRLFAAFTLNAMILLGVQIGSLLAVYGPGANTDIVGPFRPVAYLSAYCFIALTNAFIATTFQYAVALWAGKPMVSYLGSLVLFFLSYPVTLTLYLSGLHERALLADPIGIMAIMNEMMSNWTIVEKNVRMFTLEGAMLWNRLLWLAISFLTVILLYTRFRFAHRTVSNPWHWVTHKFKRKKISYDDHMIHTPIAVPYAQRSFGLKTQILQTFTMARVSFVAIASSPGGIFLLLVFPALLAFVVFTELQHWGIPLLPRTAQLLTKHLTGLLTSPSNYWIMIPLFTIYYAGELVSRERDARLNENIDATPVPEWALLLGKFIGLGLILAALMVVVMIVGITIQFIQGYDNVQIIRYVQILLGFQLTDYLLFAALALAVQTIVNQKYSGQAITLIIYVLIVCAPFIGVKHNLLIYASGPNWSFSDMRGFGQSVEPWVWFRLYWVGWAILLTVIARLLWARGLDSNFKTRLKIAHRRLTRTTMSTAVIATTIILLTGGFIFYNTNILHEYITDNELVQRRADYEREYGKYEGIPQPERVDTKLSIDIHPDQHTAAIHGSYRLVNHDSVPIDAVHLEPAFYVRTEMTFDRVAKLLVADDKLGHYIYTLDEPLQPGDSLTLHFDVRFERQGFGNAGGAHSGASQGILENGTYFTSSALPVIGYQPMRELWSAEDRKKYGLPRQVTVPSPGDIDPHLAIRPPATFEAIISTDSNQVAVAPGQLRRTWTDGAQRYFNYFSDVPVNGMEVFFSANYSVHRETWSHPSTESSQAVEIQVFIHPGHKEHLERLLRGIRASLEYYSSQFGPYPYRYMQVIEQPGNFLGMGVDGSGVITGGESFFLFDPQGENFDGIFEIVAHEVGHQWWGMQLKPAFAEGGGVISESLAWYSAMQLVKKTKGREALRRFMRVMREPNPWPPMRTGLPLLRAMDPWANYRKGPYAMHALSEYIGEERVNTALRTLIKKKASSLATTIDMYNELATVTPDSVKPLLRDLFEKDVYWYFDTKQATTKQTKTGTWEVIFDVDAHKIVSDSAGVEKEVPVSEWIEMGVFAAARPGEVLGAPLYVQKHEIHSGRQIIKIEVAAQPARGGIDPYNLLDWDEGDNIEEITNEPQQ